MEVVITATVEFIGAIINPENFEVDETLEAIENFQNAMINFSGNKQLAYKEGIFGYFQKYFASIYGRVLCDWIAIAQNNRDTKHRFKTMMRKLAHEFYLHDAELLQSLLQHPLIPLFDMDELRTARFEFTSAQSEEMYNILIRAQSTESQEDNKECVELMSRLESQIEHRIVYNEAMFMFVTRSPYFDVYLPSEKETLFAARNLEFLCWCSNLHMFSREFSFVLSRHVLMKVFRDSL